ncbi:MAG: Ldh family oxidoreductase [Sulfolobales archaeon]
MVRAVSSEFLKEVLRRVFEALGVPNLFAEVTADALVYANLRCIDSHGVSRGLDYVVGIKLGEINPRPVIRVVRETNSSVLLDGDRGLGPPVANELVERVIEKVDSTGVAIGAARNLRDVGALGYYVSKVTRAGYIGVAVANAKARVSVPGVASPIVGTNPIAVGIPSRKRTVLLDMALSVASYGKILSHAARGERIPEGWALNKYGKPTTSPEEAVEGYLLPIGGYKGLALAMIVDILAGPVIGGPVSLEITGRGPYTQGGLLVLAIDPALFRKLEEVEEAIENYARLVKSLPRDPNTEVIIPGERATKCVEERSQRGIPLDDETFSRLAKIAEELGISVTELTSPIPKV